MAETILLLEHESVMFMELLDEDGLFITAKGISVDHVLINFLKIYCDPASLVLVINTTPEEKDHLIDELVILNAFAPKAVTNEFSATERESIYLEGGVLFVTSRILVVDMLTKKLPIHLVTGIVVCRAHKIIDSCQEAFILRLYRENNKSGFVKAFSDSSQAFTIGFSQVERVMKNLFVKKLYLWPRFQATLSALLERHKPEVMELYLPLTQSMLVIQTSILDLMENTLRDIKRSNTFLDTEELTVENSINKSFDKLIRLQLDPVWHQLNAKTKQLIADLKVLRMLLQYLTQYDCITFYNFLQSLRASQRDTKHHSMWMFMDAAEPLFQHARERVFRPVEKKVKRQKTLTDEGEDRGESSTEKETSKELVLEESPKWKLLSQILEEIDKENSETTDEPGHVLIAASDERTCAQLREYLCEGGNALLTRLFNKTKKTSNSEESATSSKYASNQRTASNSGNKEKSSKLNAKRKGKALPKSSKLKNKTKQPTKTLDDFVELIEEKEDNTCQKNDTEETKSGTGKLLLKTETPDECNITFGLISTPLIVIHPLNGTSDPYSLTRTLREIEPRYVILYDPQMDFVRELEVYKASRPGVPLRVYFVIYTGSVEEQRFLTTLRKEKEAFESLIKSKGTMVIPEERDGKTEAAVQLDRDPSKPSDVLSSRKAGGRETEGGESRKIIVDMREFRSQLPSLIYKRGIDIEPVTLEVGDYILTADMCVERKSVADLISSLNSGRLYTQCVAMTRFYKQPVLLIEFDPNKSFSLQAKSSLSHDISLQNTTSKLTLLTLHFPKLKILWCHSPYSTAELFDELKGNRPEPDAAVAMTVGLDPMSTVTEVRYNTVPQDFLMKLPGINSKNCKQWKPVRANHAGANPLIKKINKYGK